MQRPGGFTFLAILLACLAIAGLGGAWAMLSGALGDMSPILEFVTLAFGLAAAAAAYGLWRWQKWATTALRAWMATCFLFILTFVYQIYSMFADSLPGIGLFLVILAVLFIYLDRYVRRKFKPVA